MRWQMRFLAVYWLISSVALTVAQSSTSSLRGDVADSSGAVVVGAQVALKNPATGFETSRVTDHRGEYRFLGVPAGIYTVSLNAKGFAVQSTVIDLLVNQVMTNLHSCCGTLPGNATQLNFRH